MNSKYWINKVMSDIYNSGDTSFYVGLSQTLPTADGTNLKEPVNGGYMRVQMQNISSPNNGSVHNIDAIVFPRSTAAWFPPATPAQYWVIFDGAGIGANILSAGRLSTPHVIGPNTTLTIPGAELRITLTDSPTE